MSKHIVPEAAVRAAFIELYEKPHIERVSSSDMRRALTAAVPHMRPKVSTEEELDTLPIGSVVLSEFYRSDVDGTAISFQRWYDGQWHRGARSSSTHPDNFLPVTVLHNPAAAL